MHMSQSLRLSENCSTCFGFHYHPFSEAQNNCNYSYYDARTHEIKKKKVHLVGPYHANDCYFEICCTNQSGKERSSAGEVNINTHHAAIRTKQLYVFARSLVNLILFNFNSTQRSTVLVK
jgi:hypothetical protein